MHDGILVINSGSSSIKFALYALNKDALELYCHGTIHALYESPQLIIKASEHVASFEQACDGKGHEPALKQLFHWLDALPHAPRLSAVGHRVVHGGTRFYAPTRVTHAVLAFIKTLNPLAPLHQPHQVKAIEILYRLHPHIPQVACFDTAFHQTQSFLAKWFALPRHFAEEGVIRYGFHGLSYEYIASVMEQYLGAVGNGRVIVAHLGNGASLCAMHQRRSVATSMGFSALDGLMMGTRCGSIDAGVLLYLLEQKGYSAQQLRELLYHQSGLLGVSGLSNNMQELLLHQDNEAVMQAIDLFCYRAALEIGRLSVALEGCDALVFTAGIGENAALVRSKICARLSAWGLTIDEQANQANAHRLSTKESRVHVAMIPTNEEWMIASHVTSCGLKSGA